MCQGQSDEFGEIVDFQLFGGPGTVSVDGLAGDALLGRDLLAAAARDEKVNNLPLARRETRKAYRNLGTTFARFVQ